MSTQMIPKLIVIVGTTAIGKTALSIALAKALGCEIVSSDSCQFFKEMQIGTAAPTLFEKQQIPHHLIQHISVKQDYSVGDFEREALQTIAMLHKKSQWVVLVGGSGLYVDAVCKGLDYFPEVDPQIRKDLQVLFEKQGLQALQALLKQKDPQYFSQVDQKNPQRLIRALEICIQTQKPFSSFRKQDLPPRPFQVIKIGLTAPRELIYERINKRVDLMMEQGLLQEVSSLKPYSDYKALQTIGYKELFKYLDGHWDLDTAVSEIKKNTRRFAKRQITWFKRDTTTKWFDYNQDVNDIISYLKQ